MHGNQEQDDEPRLVTNRTMDIAVAIFFLVMAAIVIYDSNRLGFHWQDNEGPASGYFPFYIALIMSLASIVNLVRAVMGKSENADETFVSRPAFMRVLAVLIPATVYVALIQFIGIYVASMLFIFAFMITLGKEPLLKSIAVAVGVPLALFVMFEIWFLVPLPKGPIEAMLGY
jgi:putative tricarboxylic transport membrane protein